MNAGGVGWGGVGRGIGEQIHSSLKENRILFLIWLNILYNVSFSSSTSSQDGLLNNAWLI